MCLTSETVRDSVMKNLGLQLKNTEAKKRLSQNFTYDVSKDYHRAQVGLRQARESVKQAQTGATLTCTTLRGMERYEAGRGLSEILHDLRQQLETYDRVNIVTVRRILRELRKRYSYDARKGVEFSADNQKIVQDVEDDIQNMMDARTLNKAGLIEMAVSFLNF